MNMERIRRSTYGGMGLTFLSLLFAANAYAAIIQNSNVDTSPDAFIGDCGVPGELTACIGGWNLDNVDVVLRYEDGLEFGSFDEDSGIYSLMTYGDYFESSVNGDEGQVMARITGKDWPVGEPNAIKIVTGDSDVSHGKPQNCIIGSSFLSPDNSDIEDANFLDSTHPQPVICSSPFQTHKRFKVAMLPASVDDIDSGDGHGIDLVFNVQDETIDPEAEDQIALRSYQVFSKINNYTGRRLSGYKLVIGTGRGSEFKSASESNIEDRLHLSLGRGEGASGGHENLVYDGSDIFESDSLATFSHGLFGAPDKHFTSNGFFDMRTAGFDVLQGCVSTADGACASYSNPMTEEGQPELMASDMIYSTSALASHYHETLGVIEGLPLGEWLPSKWQPKAVFFDEDNDPETDATLIAWWDGNNWRGNYDEGFPVIDQAEIDWLAANPNGLYEMGDIEDVLNLGINYIIKVGNGIPGGTFTVRVIPVVSDNQTPPAWCTGFFGSCDEPPYGAATQAEEAIEIEDDVVSESEVDGFAEAIGLTATDGGGGCTLSRNGRLDPTLLLLFVIALVQIFWRHYGSRASGLLIQHRGD
ncbi:hypothetical protein BCU83_01835 [Vibrio breoganii]|uniref:choice-of-anchor F family protein n=1 Tax=Vibrio breoganii TaxID=553239 RepID=UPI000C826746|nr:choice-of-anchor F family protein [Vibrio breoganii]PMG77685.1 hypothetical protein BCU83_01835 [Vibrio breoganii]PMK42191.1 hypothetical protein BCU00_13155 [Vibrio breoganii]PMO36049.1 hypothetical protein BCT12_09165 [Vibrio breoganii]PMO56467.1 hypothetical protein BCT07_14340 [Vibrio breoganii]